MARTVGGPARPARQHTDARLTARQHLHELARRLGSTVFILSIGAIITYIFRANVIEWLRRPLAQQLYYTSPMGGFQFVMQICLLGGFVIALPALLYHLMRFIEPAFGRHFRRRWIVGMIAASTLLALTGGAFGYFVSLPSALHFFAIIGAGKLQPLITVDQYLSFLLGYIATFALIFQLPLVLFFIDHVTPLGPEGLSRRRPRVVIGAFGVALLLPSAPDPLSQIILALPIIALFELSVVALRLRRWRTQTSKPKPVSESPSVVSQPRLEPKAVSRSPVRRPRPISAVDGFIAVSGRAAPHPQKSNRVSYATRPPTRPTRAKLISDFI